MNYLDYTVGKSFTDGTFGEDDLKFLNLSGRKSFYSQGYYGQDIIVAVVDTGVSPHEELEDRLISPGINTNQSYTYNFRNSKEGSYDDRGHGTHVACSIAGKNVGIAPKCKILSVKVLDGSGGCNNTMDIVNGIRKAIQWRGTNGEKVNIISMSLSGTMQTLGANAVENLHSAIKSAVDNNILVVCSSGNTGVEETERYPACFDEVVTVGAVDVDKQLAMFSTKGNQVDVCQVGVNVLSANYKGGYVAMSGTSMSTPLTSGIACLIACRHKQQFGEHITERKLYEALKMNTKDLGIKGVDKLFGAGFCSLQPLNVRLELKVGENTAILNGEKIKLESDTFVFSNNRNYMSIRRLGDLLGLSVKWTQETQTAILES